MRNRNEIYSRLSRCSTARGSSTRLFCVGHTKVKAHKSFFPLKVRNKESLRMRRSLVKLSGVIKSVTAIVTGCLKTDKSCHICSMRLKGVFSLVKYNSCPVLGISSEHRGSLMQDNTPSQILHEV